MIFPSEIISLRKEETHLQWWTLRIYGENDYSRSVRMVSTPDLLTSEIPSAQGSFIVSLPRIINFKKDFPWSGWTSLYLRLFSSCLTFSAFVLFIIFMQILQYFNKNKLQVPYRFTILLEQQVTFQQSSISNMSMK